MANLGLKPSRKDWNKFFCDKTLIERKAIAETITIKSTRNRRTGADVVL